MQRTLKLTHEQVMLIEFALSHTSKSTNRLIHNELLTYNQRLSIMEEADKYKDLENLIKDGKLDV